jgi:hypothetical protein
MGYTTGQVILSPMNDKNEWQFIAIAHEPDGVQVIGRSEIFASTADELRNRLIN